MSFRIFKNRFEFYIFQVSPTEPQPPTTQLFFNIASPGLTGHLDNGWSKEKPAIALGETLWAGMFNTEYTESTVSVGPSDWKIIEFPALLFLKNINPNLPIEQRDNPSEFFRQNFSITKESLEITAAELELANLRIRFDELTGNIALNNAVSQAIDDATNQVLNSQLLADLQEGISVNIPALINQAEVRLEEATNLLSNEVNNLEGLVTVTIPSVINDVDSRLNQAIAAIGDNAAAIQTETNIRVSDIESVANQITIIAASRNRVFYSAQEPIASAVGDLWFKIDENNRAFRWNGTQWEDVSDQRIVANAAAIITEQTARVTADEAIASQITTLVSSIDSNTAAIQTESTARSDADTALAEQITTLVATVDSNAAAIIAESTARADADTALAGQITTLVAAVDVNAAAIITEQNARATAISAEAQRIDTLVAAVDSNAAAIQTESTARADADTALAGQITTLVAAVDVNAAAIITEQNARATAISAEAQRIDTLVAAVDGNIAAISAESTARANADTALAGQIDTLVAAVDVNAAAIQTESTARADAVSAVASQVTTLATTVGENTASLEVSQEVVDGLSSQFMVKTDVNGFVSGFGLYNTGATSDFIVLADRFAVVTPGDDPIVPFSVDASGVFIPEAFIRNLNVEKINGQIVGNQIADGAISGSKITADAIDGKTITGALIQTSATGLRVVLGNSSFPIWYGNGAVNANNGLFYTDSFGGIVAKDSFKITVGGTDRLFFDSQNNQLTIRAKLILSDGTELNDSDDILGQPGPSGPSGAGFYSVSVATTKPTITTAYLSNLFVNKAGRQPLVGDTLFVSWTNAADAYEFNGSAWITATLVVNGNIIASGTISGSALQADAINGKTITGATFITTNVGSNFVRITASDAFGASGDLLEWFGPKISGITWNFGSNIPILAGMSKSNAKTYTTTNGDVFFGGTFVAGVLSSSQSTSLLSATASTQITFGSQGGLINMAASFSYNRIFNVEDPNNSNNWTSLCPTSLPSPPVGTLFLERWTGSGWTIVRQEAITGTVNCTAGAPAPSGNSWPKNALEPGVPAQISITGSRSFTFVDDLQTTANRQYRARISISAVVYSSPGQTISQFVSVASSEG